MSFSNRTLFYASYSRGYKGGGFSPPQTPGQELFPLTYEPEFIDAFEIGTKNTLLGGAMVLNATAVYYDHAGYQVSQIIQRTSVNINLDAKVYGVEVEAMWEPVRNLRLNANIGYLKTKLDEASALDLLDLAQTNPAYVTIKKGSALSNCIAPTDQVANLQSLINAGVLPVIVLAGRAGCGPHRRLPRGPSPTTAPVGRWTGPCEPWLWSIPST